MVKPIFSRARGQAAAGALLLVVSAAGGCAQDPDYPWQHDGGTGTGGATAGGSGGMTGGGSGGGPGPNPSACTPPGGVGGTFGRVTTPSPLISVGKRVTASTGVLVPERVVDGLYAHNGAMIPSSTAAPLPGWIAIEVVSSAADGGAAPTRLLLSWADIGWNDYNTPFIGYAPGAYQIQVSADSTNGADGVWTAAGPAVTANPVRNRSHSFDFTGKKWVRLWVTAAQSVASASADGGIAFADRVMIDEIALYDISATGATGRPQDSWFFMGDSITAGGFKRSFGAKNFDNAVHSVNPAFTPIMLNGGIGGELSAMGMAHITPWLELNPDYHHIAILYGTNDSWGNRHPTAAFEATLNDIVDKILAQGRVPILGRIPFANGGNHQTLPEWNAVIDAVTAAKGLPCGPDFYTWFRDHPAELSPDGVHPTDAGYASMNVLWAETALRLYPN